MGKFSAAKIFDAMDQKLQKAMNYLIDLLETGYVAEGRINARNVRVEVSPKVGIEIKVDNVKVFGIDGTTGEITIVDDAVKQDTSYAGVSIGATTGFANTATINGIVYVVSVNSTDGIKITANGTTVFGVTTDGYVYVNRLLDADDPTTHVEIGAVSGESGRRALALYQATPTYTTPRLRFRLKSYGTTAFVLEGIVKTAGTDVAGTTAAGFSHGDAAVSLSDVSQLKSAQIYSGNAKFEAKGAEEATMKVGNLTFGVDTVGVFSSPDNGVTRTYSVTW